MSLLPATLSAIQQAGAAVFAADAELKQVTKDYAERVAAAMSANPFGLGNDALFENWKLVARLSQTMAGIEEELKKVHQLASDLTADDTPAVRQVPVLAAPSSAPAVEPSAVVGPDLTPTDVRVKRSKKTAKPVVRATKASPRANPIKPVKAPKLADTAAPSLAIGSNPAKLLQHLEQVLNANTFTGLSQTASAQATGIPLGSMTAAIKKLMEMGRLIGGPAGSYQLAK